MLNAFYRRQIFAQDSAIFFNTCFIIARMEVSYPMQYVITKKQSTAVLHLKWNTVFRFLSNFSLKVCVRIEIAKPYLDLNFGGE